MIDIKHIEASKVEKLENLPDGAVFRYEGDFYIKSDEVDEYGDPQCLRIKDGCLVAPDAERLVEAATSVSVEVVL